MRLAELAPGSRREPCLPFLPLLRYLLWPTAELRRQQAQTLRRPRLPLELPEWSAAVPVPSG